MTLIKGEGLENRTFHFPLDAKGTHSQGPFTDSSRVSAADAVSDNLFCKVQEVPPSRRGESIFKTDLSSKPIT